MLSSFTQSIKAKLIADFIGDLDKANSNYYVTFGKAAAWPNDPTPDDANTSVTTSTYNVLKDIAYGKKVSSSDMAYMTKRIDWVSNTVYGYYTDTNPNLYSNNFYVMNSSYRVYKCLFNNYGVPSTDEPKSTSTIGDFTTSDGYIWKYMYAINSSQQKKFLSNDYIPVIPDAQVSGNAESGAIHVIEVNNSATGYDSANGYVVNYISTNIVQISNTNSSATSGEYNLSTFYVNAGTGSGTLTYITDYTVNTAGKFVTTFDPLPPLDPTSSYIISPRVVITGDGAGATAYTEVDTLNNVITKIKVLNRGSGYSFATATIDANSNFITGTSTVTPIISPIGGHGYDAVEELGSDVAGMSVDIKLTDNFPDWITYRQVALLYNPISVANNELYSDSTFSQLTPYGISNIFTPYPAGEIITGFTSGATATVLYCTATDIYLSGIVGTFVPYEAVTGTYTGATGTLLNVNSSDLVLNTGKILYFKNFEPVTRTSATTEKVKLYFRV